MTQYSIHKAVNFRDIKLAVRKEIKVSAVDGLRNTYYLQRKYDGCNAIVTVTPAGFRFDKETADF